MPPVNLLTERVGYTNPMRNPHLWAVPTLALALGAVFLIPEALVPDGRPFALWMGGMGNNAVLILGLGTLLCLALRARCGATLKLIVFAMLTETLCFLAIKAATWHQFQLLPRPSGGDGGFPSGHSAAHVCLAALLTDRFPRLAPLWYGWAALMVWSRVESGAHYGYQVAAGAALGGVVATAYLLAARRQRAMAAVRPLYRPAR